MAVLWTAMLSEHMCEGWLEGYLLTGRHGFFASYEAFIRVVDSMCCSACKVVEGLQPAVHGDSPIASLNLILSSNVWQQDHNGFTHQDPGFLDHIANKKADVVRHVSSARYQLPAYPASITASEDVRTT